jgi:Putative DNA-binding domain
MVDLFGVPWSSLKRDNVESFLSEAGDEGVTWEAKGGGPDAPRPRAASIQKAACGLANQIGGFLLIGASKVGARWKLNGIEAPAEEPALWVGQILRQLQPVPRFEVSEPFTLADGRVSLVVKIDPVASPPCMTPDGRVFERVSGETLPVRDPALLERLIRRGDHARGRAEYIARRAAERAILLPGWFDDHCFSISVGVASVGRVTEDIASRLFTERCHEAMLKAIWDLIGDEQPEIVDVFQAQDRYTALAQSRRNQHTGLGGRLIGITRYAKFVQANWDGSVAAGMWFSDDLLHQPVDPDLLIAKCWAETEAIATLLGGYGPVQLQVLMSNAKDGQQQQFGQGAVIQTGREAPDGTLFSKLPRKVEMSRSLEIGPVGESVIDSLRRELQRAAGVRTDEPINETPDDP